MPPASPSQPLLAAWMNKSASKPDFRFKVIAQVGAERAFKTTCPTLCPIGTGHLPCPTRLPSCPQHHVHDSQMGNIDHVAAWQFAKGCSWSSNAQGYQLPTSRRFRVRPHVALTLSP